MAFGEFLKSINISFLFCFVLFIIQVKGIIPTPVTEPFNFNKINRIWVGKLFYCRTVRVFYDWFCVSACAVTCIECKKNRRQDSALWRACGNRAGRRECNLVANLLRTVNKKVDNPENQSWVNLYLSKENPAPE